MRENRGAALLVGVAALIVFVVVGLSLIGGSMINEHFSAPDPLPTWWLNSESPPPF